MREIYTIWGNSRFFACKFGMELFYNVEDKKLQRQANSWIKANSIIEAFIGCELGDEGRVQLRLVNVPVTHPLQFMINTSTDTYLIKKFLHDEHNKLRNYYCQFLLVQMTLLLTSFPPSADVTDESLSIIESFLENTFNEAILLILELDDELENRLQPLLEKMVAINSDPNLTGRQKLSELRHRSSSISSILTPTSIKLIGNMDLALDLINELEAITPGREDAKKYETFCFNVMKHLLIPPFEELRFQQGNIDRSHIRDLVLTNNVPSGFWSHIRTEFASKYIICECKNEKQSGKASVVQLFYYLGKQSFGNFAILLVRTANQPLLREIRDLYGKSTYIFLIDDETLKDFILGYALLGNLEKQLQSQKTKFETSF